MLHKKDEETLTNRSGCNGEAESSPYSRMHQRCIPGAVRYFSIFLPFGKAGGLQIHVAKGSQ
jgi:hypothetical protein